MRFRHTFVAFVAAVAAGCSHPLSLPLLSTADSIAIVRENLDHRAEVDSFFSLDSASPFRRDSSIAYHGIHWFPINPRFCGASALHRYADAETVVVMGTKGESRRELRYGYFEFVVPDGHWVPHLIKLNAYKFTPYDAGRYALYRNALSVWFTDSTTGRETYGVGRYVEVGDEDPDPSHVYVIDLNKAYNPYCAYSALYSCAVPRQEDYLPLAVRVGEMKYHE